MTSDTARRAAEFVAFARAHSPLMRARLGPGEAVPLHEVPPLTKRELIEDQMLHPPLGTNLTRPPHLYVRVHQTSGTTGPPLKVPETAADWRWWGRGLARCFRAAGIGPGDRVALAFSFGPHVQFWAAVEGLRSVGAMALPLGGMTSLQRLQMIAALEATALMSTPSYALRLADVARREGLEAALATVRVVLCTGEPGGSLPTVRARIAETYGAACLDHAGLTEVGPFGLPCSHGGLHVDEDAFACEIVTEDLQPVAEGEQGELVLTPLERLGFPVPRYRTGDIVVATSETCPAGHRGRWLPGGIVGRADDMVVIRGMNVYPSAIEEAVRQVSPTGAFRITFYTEAGLDQIKLEVELGDAVALRRLQEAMRARLGLRVRVVPVAPGALPGSDGKARLVVDERVRGEGR